MPRGRIVHLAKERGFGAINAQGITQDVYFHHSALASGLFQNLTEGQEVEFEVTNGPKGPQAENVMKVA